MARGFGTTLGAATTDNIVTTLTSHATLRSFAFWANRNAAGGSSLGRVFDKRTAGAQVELVFNNEGSTRYEYNRQWTGNGQWSWARPATSTWTHTVVTYDAGATTNNPIVYVNGSLVTVTTVAAPTGTLTTNTDAYVLGNRSNDNARNWDGSLAWFGVWDVILDAVDAAALGVGVSPLLIQPASLVCFEPMVRDNINTHLAASAITGTAVQPHPLVWESRKTRVSRYVTGADTLMAQACM